MRKKTTKKNQKKNIDLTNNIGPPDDTVFTFKNRLKPKTDNQTNYIRTIAENTITFCQGVAGSGKTHIAIGMALEYLLSEKVERIIITRPVLEAGEKIGYLPGTAEEKLHPYLLPILDEINYFIQVSLYNKLKLLNRIEIVPLGLMRGRSFHKCFIVADECQNASYDQLKMLLTRIGLGSKMVLTGDIAQSDLQKIHRGGFTSMSERLSDVEGIGLTKLEYADVIRNPIIAHIIARLEDYENNS